MKAFAIDTDDFCRLKERAEGTVATVELRRLAQECAEVSGTLHWSLQGGSDTYGHARLELAVSGAVQLMCQRCLKPFSHQFATQSMLVLAPDDEAADEIEVLLGDDTIDVIVGSKRLDVMALVEDDALLALPFTPKHDVCPDRATAEQLEEVKKPSPFSVLKNLK